MPRQVRSNETVIDMAKEEKRATGIYVLCAKQRV